MALQFIIGRSGSGKSTALYQKIIKESMEHPEQNYILIVPDQFTLDTQKTVINMHPLHGTMNIDIVSFHRLAYKVFEEIRKEPGVVLEDLGKTMVLQRILGKKEKDLPLFGSNRDKMGFLDELKSLLSEFYQYRITKESLDKQVAEEEKGTLLYEKLSELSVVLREFEAFMGQDYIVAEQLLSVLGERAGESSLLRGSIVCLDGFTGFTPVQYEFLEKLLPLCSNMYVTVTMDEQAVGFQKILDYELFAMSKETIAAFREIARKNQVPILENWLIYSEKKIEGTWKRQGRFEQNSELAFLEKNLFRPKPETYPEKTKKLTVHLLKNPEEEALFAARIIAGLVREKGYRYREIGIVSGDLERYGSRLLRIFADYRIPCFLDDTRGMRSHPLVECIRGLFALAEYDFSYESVCHYIKNGMTEMTGEEGDSLDNYLLATGIRGYSAFTKEFTRKPGKMGEKIFDQAENARKKMMEELAPLLPVFRKKQEKVRSYLTALFHYMLHMNYEEKLKAEEQRFEKEGDFVMMKAYSQVYSAVLDLLDKIAAILGEEEMTLSELLKILDAGLSQMSLGVIPPGIDQVVIGDVERTRMDHKKVLLFLGVNEGVIPKPQNGGGILSDMDREYLRQEKFSLAPGARQNTALEQFYLYLTLTKPSDGLYLTLSSVDQEGKSIRPSYLIGRLELLFPELTVKKGEENGNSYFTKKASLPRIREAMSNFLEGREREEDQAFLSWMFQTEEGKNWILKGIEGRFYTNREDSLSRQAAKALYGTRLNASVTRLETYGKCPFAHFLQYGLMLKERQKFQLRSVDMGQILHRCMELFSKEVTSRETGFRGLLPKERDELVKNCLRQAVEELGSVLFHSSARNEACIDRMERLVKRTVWAVTEQIKRGDFLPEEFEWRFASRKDLSAVSLPLKNGGTLELQGVVDRMDFYEDEDEIYIKIIDYKSGAQKFQLEDVYYGLQLQLIVYLNAAVEKARQEKEKNVVPAGVFYFHIQDPLVEEPESGSVEEELLDEFKLSGLALKESEVITHMDNDHQRSLPVSFLKNGNFSSNSSVASREEFELLESHVKMQLKQYGNEILDGKIEITPYRDKNKTACDYCPYRGVCGFDPAFSGNHFQKRKSIKKEEIWKELERR